MLCVYRLVFHVSFIRNLSRLFGWTLTDKATRKKKYMIDLKQALWRIDFTESSRRCGFLLFQCACATVDSATYLICSKRIIQRIRRPCCWVLRWCLSTSTDINNLRWCLSTVDRHQRYVGIRVNVSLSNSFDPLGGKLTFVCRSTDHPLSTKQKSISSYFSFLFSSVFQSLVVSIDDNIKEINHAYEKRIVGRRKGITRTPEGFGR